MHGWLASACWWFSGLNAIGVEVFGKVEVFLTFGMWTTLISSVYAGILLSPVTHHSRVVWRAA